MTILMEREDDQVVIHAPVVTQSRAREIPGARHDSRARVWRYPLSWATCVVARGIFGSQLDVGPELAEWARNERERVVKALTLREAKDADGPEYLYPYQRAGVAFLQAADSALLADDMGTGKTAQAVHAAVYPLLVACPNSVKSVWEAEFAKWAPEVRVVVAGSGTVAAHKAAQAIIDGEADVLVVNWEALKNLSRLAEYGSIRLQSCSQCDPTSSRRPAQCEREPKILNTIEWAMVIADEAHRAKDPRSKQTRALWAVGDKAKRRIALTGTPVANTPDDIWPIMRFVAPKEYPARTRWIERYALTVPNPYSMGVDVIGLKPETRAEFDKFFLPRFIRRTKEQVLPDLPPKTYERRDVFLSGKQKKAYDAMRDGMIAALDEGTLAETNKMTAALRLRQLASAYGEMVVDPREAVQALTFDDVGRDFDRVDAHMILTEPSSKLDVLEEVLQELSGKQAVIFAESRQLIEMAFRRLNEKYVCGMLAGPVNTSERAVAVQNFQAGNSQLILVTVGAGGEGITLTAADTAIFLQRPWSRVLNDQAEDRLHRIGQEAQNVLYIDLVAANTIEEKVFDALADKEANLQELVRDEDALRRWLA